MKKTFLAAVLAMTLCVPAFAEEQFTNDSRHAHEFPVFGNEDQERANLGMHEETFSSSSGRIHMSNKEELQNANIPDLSAGFGDEKQVVNEADSKDKKGKKYQKIEKPVKQGPIPVYLAGDHIEFENATGDFVATSKVKVQQGGETLLTDYAFGNMKTGDIYLLQGGTIVEPSNRTDGKWVHYNFNTKTGEMKEVKGKGLKDFYTAPHLLVLPDKMIADQGGETTRCFAKEHAPCLSVKAKVMEFYPKEKMVAHDVKVFVKGKHIYSRKLWVNEFEPNKENIIKPSVGWNGGTNGFYGKLEVAQHITPKDSAHVTLADYSRAGFKPNVTVRHNERNFDIRYMNGWVEDDDVWYLRQNDWRFRYKPHHFIKGLPLTFSAEYERGLWSRWDPDTSTTSYRTFRNAKTRKPTFRGSRIWHSEYKYYINHDPIKIFGPDTTLHLTYGRKWVKEGHNPDERVTDMYYSTLRQKINRNLNMWTGYMYEKKQSSMFDLGQPDMEKEWRLGVQYKLGNNVFSVVNRYDIGKNAQYKTTYNWYHRFCCWALNISYEKKWNEAGNKRKTMIKYYLFNW